MPASLYWKFSLPVELVLVLCCKPEIGCRLPDRPCARCLADRRPAAPCPALSSASRAPARTARGASRSSAANGCDLCRRCASEWWNLLADASLHLLILLVQMTFFCFYVLDCVRLPKILLTILLFATSTPRTHPRPTGSPNIRTQTRSRLRPNYL